MKPDDAGFGDRLAFLRWVWHLDHAEPPTNEEIGEAADHTGQWLTGLLKAQKAPTKGADHHALARHFGVSERWLIYNEGSAPRHDLWKIWRNARSVEKSEQTAVLRVETAPRKKIDGPAKSRAAAAGKRNK